MTTTQMIRLAYLSLFSFSQLQAATLIESRTIDDSLNRIIIESDKVKLDMPEDNSFMLMDLKTNSLKMVIHNEKQVMDMSEFIQSDKTTASSSDSRYQIKKKGSGPKLLGYDTTEYAIYANKQYCGSSFVSAQAMKDTGLSRFADKLSDLQSGMNQQMSQMGGIDPVNLSSDCEKAEEALDKKLSKIGMPLRSINADRQLQSEITKIQKNYKLSANSFSIPKGYKQTSQAEAMNEAMQGMQQEMQDMMKNMPPEMRQMIEQQMQQ